MRSPIPLEDGEAYQSMLVGWMLDEYRWPKPFQWLTNRTVHALIGQTFVIRASGRRTAHGMYALPAPRALRDTDTDMHRERLFDTINDHYRAKRRLFCSIADGTYVPSHTSTLWRSFWPAIEKVA